MTPPFSEATRRESAHSLLSDVFRVDMAGVTDQRRETDGQKAVARTDISDDASRMYVHRGEDVVDPLPLLPLGFMRDVLGGDGERDEYGGR